MISQFPKLTAKWAARSVFPDARKTKNGKTFMQNLEQTWDNTYNYSNLTRTENGAWGYKSTGNKLLDLNFAVASLRGKYCYTKSVDNSRHVFISSVLAKTWS